jgi:hypothetical protein
MGVADAVIEARRGYLSLYRTVPGVRFMRVRDMQNGGSICHGKQAITENYPYWVNRLTCHLG